MEWVDEDICIHVIDYDAKKKPCRCAKGEENHAHHKFYPSS